MKIKDTRKSQDVNYFTLKVIEDGSYIAFAHVPVIYSSRPYADYICHAMNVDGVICAVCEVEISFSEISTPSLRANPGATKKGKTMAKAKAAPKKAPSKAPMKKGKC